MISPRIMGLILRSAAAYIPLGQGRRRCSGREQRLPVLGVTPRWGSPSGVRTGGMAAAMAGRVKGGNIFQTGSGAGKSSAGAGGRNGT